MGRKARNEVIQARFFRWILKQRDGRWYADGRGNSPNLGRQSLGAAIYQDALRALHRLDLTMAVEQGLAEATELEDDGPTLELDVGRDRYLKKLNVPALAGGVSPKTQQRYKPVFDKFLPFARQRGVQQWNHVTRHVLLEYLDWLEDDGYMARTLYFEGTVIKQVVNWFVEEKLLPVSCRLSVPLRKPQDSPTYCWRSDEVAAMLRYCGSQADLVWLGDLLLALASTGLRISEAAALRWSDIDLEAGMLRLTNDRLRQTKNRRDRSLPLDGELLARLKSLPHARDGRVFHGPRGGELKPDTVRNIFIREVLTPLAERYPSPAEGLGFPDGRLHSFRHYFCSVCANSGVPERMVMDWLGHQDSRMVRHYYHLNDTESKRQMSRLKFVGPGDSVVVEAASEPMPARAS